MTPARIYILIPQYNPADLVGMDARELCDTLRNAGYLVQMVAGRRRSAATQAIAEVSLLDECPGLDFGRARAIVYYHGPSWPAGEQVFERSGSVRIIRYFGWPARVSPERIFAVPHAYSLAVSAFAANKSVQMGASPDYCSVLFPFHGTERLTSPACDESLHQQYSGAVNILAVGAVVPTMCYDRILESFAVYHRCFNKNSRLLIAGRVPRGTETYLAYLTFLTKQLELEGHVEFVGAADRQQLRSLYECASVVLLMSDRETFPTCIPQALGTRTPLIALATGAIPELVSRAAIVVDEYNPGLVGCHIARVVEEPAVRDDLIRKGSELYRTRFESRVLQSTAVETLSRWIR